MGYWASGVSRTRTGEEERAVEPAQSFLGLTQYHTEAACSQVIYKDSTKLREALNDELQ